MADFLFELLVEEVPHGVLPHTNNRIKEALPKILEKYGFICPDIQYFVTPRRFGVLIKNIPTHGADRFIEQKGPSVKILLDYLSEFVKTDSGKNIPELKGFLDEVHLAKDLKTVINGALSWIAGTGLPRPIEGFLSSNNADVADLVVHEVKGQLYFFINKSEKGKSAEQVLPFILEELWAGIKFTEPMRWNKGEHIYEFIRPVRGITALLDSNIIPINLFGLESGNILYAHRQISPEPITLLQAHEYESVLESHGVVPSFEKRRQYIQDKTAKIAADISAEALLDDELLTILTSLTEYPHPLLAEFDSVFLSLPKEVLISEMKVHQKYIPLVEQSGKLLPYYIITANIPYNDPETKNNILSGNDKVLCARFSDGRFFFEEDIKKGLLYYAENLKSVSFVEGAGSLADKSIRMTVIAEYLRNILAPQISKEHLKEAIILAKADLSSLMVGEFPELQGIMGSYYADEMNCSSEVALAIKEHYYPMNIDGEYVVPTQQLSALVGLADRIDSLFTLYAVGKSVTGSRDPYALRRQTIACIHILLQYNWEKFSLKALFEAVKDIYKPMIKSSVKEWQDSLEKFILTRLEGVLKGDPYTYASDTLNAALSHTDFIVEDVRKVSALDNARKQSPVEFAKIAELAKRIMNITKDQPIQEFQENLLEEDAEQKLYQYFVVIENKLAELTHEQVLLELLTLRSPIEKFFEHVMVKTGDKFEINRIALLQKIGSLFMERADFSKLSS